MNELSEVAIAAFRAGRYHDAIEFLLQITDFDPIDYGAKLYLAMAYEKSGRIVDAQRLFKRLSEQCPDDHIRVRAESALPIIEAEMRRRFDKEPLKKNSYTSPNDVDDIVWVG